MKIAILFLLCLANSIFASSKLSIGMLGEFHPSHPYLAQSETNIIANSFLLQPILSLEKKWTWKCRLCTQVPTQANRGIEVFTDKTGIQKLAIHLELPEAKWGNGQNIGLKDVAFTWQLIKHLPPNSRSAIALQDIEDILIRPQETRHFTILLRSVTDPYPILNSFYIVSEHLEQPLVDKDKTWNTYFTNSLYVKEPSHSGLYNTAFVLSSQTDQHISLQRNTSSGVPTKIDNIELSFFASLDELGKALLSGKIDMAPDLSAWNDTLSLLESLKKDGKTFEVARDDGFHYEHLDFNLQNPIFQDSRVRKALAYAIDKELILQQITENWTIPASSPIHPSSPYISGNIPFYEFSLSKAKALLNHSDWQIASDGYCTKKNRTLAFEILTIDDPIRIKTANYLAQAWKKIGAKVSVKFLPLSEFREKIARRHFSGLALYSWKLGLFQNTRSLFHSAAIPSLGNAYSGQNITGWINAHVDDSLTKFASTIQESERKHQMEIFQKEYATELPGLALFFRTQMSLLPKNLRSFVLPSSHAGMGLAASEWYLQN